MCIQGPREQGDIRFNNRSARSPHRRGMGHRGELKVADLQEITLVDGTNETSGRNGK